MSAVPKLRFPEFDGKWEDHNFGEICSFSKGKGISKSDISEDGALPCIRYGELYTHYGVKIDEVVSRTNVPADALVLSEGGEVIIPASGETPEDISTAAVVIDHGVALGGDLNILRTNSDGYFLASYISGKARLRLASMAQGNSVVHLYGTQIASLGICLPSLPEQQKIASFLSSIDKKIDLLRQKKDALELYKTGLMQKIFSQEIRFKQDDGSDFPEWEEIVLGKICKIGSSKRVMQKDWKDQGVPFLRTREVINLAKGVSFKTPIFLSHDLFAELKAKYGTPVAGDILVTGVGSIGHTYIVEPEDEFYFKDGNVLWIRSSNMLNSKFLAHQFKHRYIQKQIMDNASITTVATFTIDDAKKLKILFPSLAEQQKIASFLSAIDTKIQNTSSQIEQMETFKKGLLQQMFV